MRESVFTSLEISNSLIRIKLTKIACYNHYRTFHYYVYKEQQRTKNDFNTKIDNAQNKKIDIAQH